MPYERSDIRPLFNLSDTALKEFPTIDRAASFQIEGEHDERGRDVDGKVFWVRVVDCGHFIEGKLYQPERLEGNKELVVFEPGLPGDGVIIFEDRHAPSLVKEGYTIFVGRHNGTEISIQKAY